jgi:hypothetical protein
MVYLSPLPSVAKQKIRYLVRTSQEILSQLGLSARFVGKLHSPTMLKTIWIRN